MPRVLIGLLALTLTVLLADLAGAPLGPLRSAGAAAFGPLERLVAPGGSRADALTQENLLLREEVRRLEERHRVAAQVDDLPVLEGTTTTARVVALERSGASGPERVTIDVGRHDGIRPDSAVIAPGGLVGRVVEVGSRTADVEVVGSPQAGVGVRTGAKGVIGTLTGSDPTTSHDTDELVVTHLGRDRVETGDEVATLGSPGGRPYPPGVTIGVVSHVERPAGALTDTALVDPAVDLTTLDVVAVVTGAQGSTS